MGSGHGDIQIMVWEKVSGCWARRHSDYGMGKSQWMLGTATFRLWYGKKSVDAVPLRNIAFRYHVFIVAIGKLKPEIQRCRW